MKKLFIIFILSLLSISCQNIEMPDKPDNLIDRDTMVEVLVDTYLSNAVRSKNYLEVKHKNIRLDKYIYQKYAIDSLQFSESNAYYTADMDGYLEMLKEVEQKLNQLKGIEEGEPIKETETNSNQDSGEEEL